MSSRRERGVGIAVAGALSGADGDHSVHCGYREFVAVAGVEVGDRFDRAEFADGRADPGAGVEVAGLTCRAYSFVRRGVDVGRHAGFRFASGPHRSARAVGARG